MAADYDNVPSPDSEAARLKAIIRDLLDVIERARDEHCLVGMECAPDSLAEAWTEAIERAEEALR